MRELITAPAMQPQQATGAALPQTQALKVHSAMQTLKRQLQTPSFFI